MSLRSTRPPDLARVSAILAAGRGPVEDAGDGADPDAEVAAGPGPGHGWVPRAPEGARRLVAEAAGRVRPVADDEVGRLDAALRRARRPAVLTAPDELRAGRRGVSSAAAVALLALVVAVGCAFVVRVLWAERSSSTPVAPRAPEVSVRTVPTVALVPAAGPGRAGSTPPAASGAGTPTTPAGGAAVVVVHVVGQVARPGLVRLPAGSRVADAVEAAGGARRGADLGALNLARLVVDGEQVHVPRPGEVVAAAGAPPSGGAGSGGGPSGGPVDLNTADLSALDALPGVGPVLAQRILDWRTEHGRFTSVDELGEVSGIGDTLLGRLRPQVTL